MGLLTATTASWYLEGVDISRQMLKDALSRLTSVSGHPATGGKIASLSLHCGDASHLPQADSTIDLAISAHMIEHLLNPVRALCEIYRVLQPGAPVVLFITRKGLVGRYIRHKWGITCVSDLEAQRLLEAAGFTQVQSVSIGNPFLPCAWSSVAMIGVKPPA